MPQASDELRDKMEEYFGTRIGPEGPIYYLMGQGFRIGPDGWIRPQDGIVSPDDIGNKEWDCIDFLIQEWDYAYVDE